MADLVSKLLNPVIERRAGMTIDLQAYSLDILDMRMEQNFIPPELFHLKDLGLNSLLTLIV